LYNDLSKKETTTFTDISKIEAIDLSSATKNYQTRQGYHQMKDYNIINNRLKSSKKTKKEIDKKSIMWYNCQR